MEPIRVGARQLRVNALAIHRTYDQSGLLLGRPNAAHNDELLVEIERLGRRFLEPCLGFSMAPPPRRAIPGPRGSELLPPFFVVLELSSDGIPGRDGHRSSARVVHFFEAFTVGGLEALVTRAVEALDWNAVAHAWDD